MLTIKYHTGDVVKYINRNGSWKYGSIHIIHETSYEGNGVFKYSTNRGAWFDSKDFTLVRRADKDSFKQLDKSLEDEEEKFYG